jgi:phage tail sheath protein FI|tara:strand:- start:1658 stop:3760 length:2103 start_codon:yes stop_codon:yes gene_type:complete
MSFLKSPGVHVREIDLTTIVPAVSTSIGAIAGAFEKGPVNSIVTVGSEEDLVKVFGKPQNSSNQFETFFTAANFLQYTDQLKVVRCESGVTNAIASGTSILIRDDDHYEDSFEDGQASVGEWAARTAGIHGNSLGVSICANAAAYEETAVTTTSAEEALGQTVISVTDGTVFTIHDIVNFGETLGFEYQVTAADASTITIKLKDDPNGVGLQSTIATATNIRRRWRFYDLFDAAPGTSDYATQNQRGTLDEIHVVVYDQQGEINGFAVESNGNRTSAVLETFANLSKNPNCKSPQGDSVYYADKIFRTSSFIYWMDHNSAGTNWGTDFTGETSQIVMEDGGTDGAGANAGDNIVLDATDTSNEDENGNIELEIGGTSYAALDTPTTSNLKNGTDDYAVTAGELEIAYDNFEDTESVDVNLILGGKGGGAGDSASTQDTHVTMLHALVETRRDCVAFASPHRSATVGVSSSITATDNVVDAFDLCPSSSYMVFDSAYKQMYDKYNDVFRFVPMNGDTAGLCAFTDQVADAWFSPGGFNRGNVRGAIKLSYNPKKSERDQLYRARINPIVDFPGQGVVLFGDKTALAKPSAFDRINVRRLFLVLEKSISIAAKFSLFEFNDEFTRAQFRNLIEPFLRDVQGRRGIFDFRVVCDDTNNTGEVIDRNEFIGDIYIKPARSINFITLNFIAVRTGVEFSEVVGQF